MMTRDEKNALKQAYNNTAERRDQSSMALWKVEERRRFLERLKLEGKRSLLEIDAGTGRDSLYFQEQGLGVTPVDFSEENDSYEPKRFFSMYEDDEIVKTMARRFQVEDFHTVDMGAGTPHFQSITMRKTVHSET